MGTADIDAGSLRGVLYFHNVNLDTLGGLEYFALLGDMIHVEIKSKEFGRIATQNAKNVILQKIRGNFGLEQSLYQFRMGTADIDAGSLRGVLYFHNVKPR